MAALVCALYSCASAGPVYTEPPVRQAWVNRPPANTEEELFIVGISRRFPSKAEARDDAHRNAGLRAAEYHGFSVRTQTTDTAEALTHGTAVTDRENYTRRVFINTRGLITREEPQDYYTEVYYRNGQEEYVVYVLSRFPLKNTAETIPPFEAPPAAALGFDGSPLSPANRNALTRALREGLQQNGVPLLLEETEAPLKQAEYAFTITLIAEEFPSTLVRPVLSLSFLRKGLVVYQASWEGELETSLNHRVIQAVSDYIRLNSDFYRQVAALLF
jgi:hypothetical protein